MAGKAHQTTPPSEMPRLRPAALPRITLFWSLALLPFFLAACHRHASPPSAAPARPLTLDVPATGAYTGAYIDFGDYEDSVTLEAIEGFENLVGKRQAIIASSSYWGEQSFPTANLNLIHRHGSVPLLFWSPWDRPYAEDQGPDKFSLTSIIAGRWDDYIDQWAHSARDFGQPLLVSFANEMNGSWFPWSGRFYGGERPVPNSKPEKYEGPETFKKAYRHVVDRVRAAGGTNVLWIFHVKNYSYPQESWNMIAQYYPGSEYVDWIGLSVYGEQYSDDPWSPFPPLLDWPYQEVSMLDPHKPIMLAEWACGEFPSRGDKTSFIREAFESMPKYPRLKAAVYWNERWQNEDDSYSNLRVNSSPESLAAFRKGMAQPFWVATPIFGPRN